MKTATLIGTIIAAAVVAAIWGQTAAAQGASTVSVTPTTTGLLLFYPHTNKLFVYEHLAATGVLSCRAIYTLPGEPAQFLIRLHAPSEGQ